MVRKATSISSRSLWGCHTKAKEGLREMKDFIGNIVDFVFAAVIVIVIGVSIESCEQSNYDGPTSFIGIEFGTPLSLKAINSKYHDESDLEREKCDSMLGFRFGNTTCYNYYPQSPLSGFKKYQVVVDNDTNEIIGIIAEGDEEFTPFAVFKEEPSTDRVYDDTRKWLDKQFPDFTTRIGTYCDLEAAVIYTNNGLFARKRPANQAGLKYKGCLLGNLKIQLFICRDRYDIYHSFLDRTIEVVKERLNKFLESWEGMLHAEIASLEAGSIESA